MLANILERVRFAKFCILHRRSLRTQKKWQYRHFARLLCHAYENVPIWRSLLDEKGIQPDFVRTLADITKLPITNKQLYLGKMAEEYTDGLSQAPALWFVTSGTSGVPFTFLLSEHARDERYQDFASLRFLWWRGESLKNIAHTNYARIKIQARSSTHRFFVSVGEYLKNPPNALERIGEYKTVILGTYPSLLLEIAEQVKKNSALQWPELRFALSFGETMHPSVRSTVKEALGCEVYDRYGLEEIGVIGLECAEHNGLHIHTESILAEVVDDSDAQVSDGIEGRIIATDLFNFGMPFIRYDTGDHGSISHEPCRCGLKSPRIWVRGRYSTYLTFPQRRIHHLEFDAVMDSFMNSIFQYQIAKKSDTEILVRVIPGPAFHPEISEKVQTNLAKLVGEKVHVGISVVQELPRTQTGKSRIVIDESGQ